MFKRRPFAAATKTGAPRALDAAKLERTEVMKSILLIAALGAGAAAPAPAPTPAASKVDALFSVADVNGDGALSEQEYLDYSAAKARADYAKMSAGGVPVTKERVAALWAKPADDAAAAAPKPAPKN